MSEPKGPDLVLTNVAGFDQIQFFDVEMIEDEEGMKAVMAWAAARKAAEVEAAAAAAGDTKPNDPDRPAA
jgi:hypothetical protein